MQKYVPIDKQIQLIAQWLYETEIQYRHFDFLLPERIFKLYGTSFFYFVFRLLFLIDFYHCIVNALSFTTFTHLAFYDTNI